MRRVAALDALVEVLLLMICVWVREAIGELESVQILRRAALAIVAIRIASDVARRRSIAACD